MSSSFDTNPILPRQYKVITSWQEDNQLHEGVLAMTFSNEATEQ